MENLFALIPAALFFFFIILLQSLLAARRKRDSAASRQAEKSPEAQKRASAPQLPGPGYREPTLARSSGAQPRQTLAASPHPEPGIGQQGTAGAGTSRITAIYPQRAAGARLRLESLPPLRRAVLWAEILGPPAGLK